MIAKILIIHVVNVDFKLDLQEPLILVDIEDIVLRKIFRIIKYLKIIMEVFNII